MDSQDLRVKNVPSSKVSRTHTVVHFISGQLLNSGEICPEMVLIAAPVKMTRRLRIFPLLLVMTFARSVQMQSWKTNNVGF
jgi:hypothetical protein